MLLREHELSSSELRLDGCRGVDSSVVYCSPSLFVLQVMMYLAGQTKCHSVFRHGCDCSKRQRAHEEYNTSHPELVFKGGREKLIMVLCSSLLAWRCTAWTDIPLTSSGSPALFPACFPAT